MIGTILVRLPVDLTRSEPLEEAARQLRDIIEQGMRALPDVPRWQIELDESIGIIT